VDSVPVYTWQMESVLQPEALPAIDELADFDAVVRCHQRAIYGFVLASLRDRDAAETLTQDCFLKAYRSRRNFRGESSVKTWLMRIAVNLVRDHASCARLKFWRRASRTDIDVAAFSARVADGRRSPEAVVVAKEKIEAVWSAAAGLSHKQRTVLLLRFVEDMDILEIAAATGMKEGTVKVHLFRALQTVRARIEGGK
jgi:RNA polymerase sigma-70 factor (ECF subfamily)